MARKKTVSLSRKPSLDETSAVAIEAADEASLPPLNLKLQPYAESLGDSKAGSRCPVVQVVYGTVYCMSYGVVYGVILLGKLIPGSKLLGHAMQDGATAAALRFELKSALVA